MKNNGDRNKAISLLIENVNDQNYIPQDDISAFTIINGIKKYMPAYIPYVGTEYFNHRPRILCYAINQNLSRHRSWSNEWMREWAINHLHAIDRLNHAAEVGEALPIKPYAEGFIPLAALLCHSAYENQDFNNLPPKIDNVISVTNFVKFSTSDSASSTEIPDSWWHECGKRFVYNEIQILKPDIIITFGKITHMRLQKVLEMNYNCESLNVYNCRFPARIPSERSRPVNGNDKKHWVNKILPMSSRINNPHKSFVQKRMTRFPGYFIDIAKEFNLI